MTDTQINVAIAKACGWVWQEGTEPSYGGTNIPRGWINPKTKRCLIHLPDYANDLNAICAACHEKFKERIQRDLFCYEVVQIVGVTATFQGRHTDEFDELHPTARQRAEAFLKTIGEWKK